MHLAFEMIFMYTYCKLSYSETKIFTMNNSLTHRHEHLYAHTNTRSRSRATLNNNELEKLFKRPNFKITIH